MANLQPETGDNAADRRQPKFFFLDDVNPAVLGAGDLIAMMRRHLLLIVTTIFLGTSAAGLIAFVLPDVFVASSTLVLEQSDKRVLESDPSLHRREINRTAIETEIDIIRSRGFAGQVIDAFSFTNNPLLNPYLGQNPPWYWHFLPQKVIEQAAQIGLDLEQWKSRELPDAATQREQTINLFLSNMTIVRTGESLAMSIRFANRDAQMASFVSNAITSFYVERSLEQKLTDNNSAILILRNRTEKLATDIAETEGAISELRRIYQLDETDDKLGDQLQAEAAQLLVRLQLSENEKKTAVQHLENLEQIISVGLPLESPPESLDPLLSELVSLKVEEERLLKETKRVAELSSRRLVDVADVATNLDNIKQQIGDETLRLRMAAQQKLRTLDTNIERLQAELSRVESRTRERDQAKIRLAKLERELLTDQQRYNQILEGLGILDLQAETLKPTARVVSSADIPTKASSPNRRFIAGGGLVGSTIIAFVLVLIAESLNKKVRVASQIQKVSHVPNLAYVPEQTTTLLKRKRDPYRAIVERDTSLFTESIRSLFLGIRRVRPTNSGQVIMITSGLPGEGKTAVSMSLAAVAAINGRKTAIVDLDFHRSGIATSLNLLEKDGSLADYLTEGRPIEEIVHTDVALPDVDIFCVTGKVKDRSSLAGSQRMVELFNTLRDGYDAVIVDTPPVLVVNDAGWSAIHSDAAVFVVHWGQTTEDAAKDALERLRLDHAPLIGTVINRVKPKQHSRYGYGGNMAYYYHAQGYYTK